MTSWRDEYISALQERDKREKESYQKVDSELLDAFTNLLDHTAALEAFKAAHSHTQSPPTTSKSSLPDTNESASTAQLRADLAEALRSAGQLNTRLKAAEAELIKLRKKTKEDGRAIDGLEREVRGLSRKIKDKEEESKGKTRLLDDVHDEVVSLELQLNMSEQNVTRLKKENQDLIDRWVASKQQEVEKMNEAFEERR